MKWKDKPLVRFTLRLPEDLHHKLKKKTEKGVMGISLNDYIIKILLRSLDQNIPL